MYQQIDYRDYLHNLDPNDSLENIRFHLNKINNLISVSEVEIFFEELINKKNWDEKTYDFFDALMYLVTDKFLAPCSMNSYYGQKNVPNTIDTKDAIWFDITDYPNSNLDLLTNSNLKSLNITNSKMKSIYLNNIVNIESIVLGHNRNLEKIEINPDLLRFIILTKCPKMNDFSVFYNSRNLFFADFSNNKNLKNIEFMENFQNLLTLNLMNLNILDSPHTLEVLKELKNLKILFISANKETLQLYREALPHCRVNK